MKSLTAALLAACAVTAGAASANDFPTQARVEYVLQCMTKNGGQSYDTLYPCICAIDKIAAKTPYDRYVQAETLGVMMKTPGEKGGAFRDAPGGRDFVTEFRKTLQDAEESCFINRTASSSDG